MASVAGHLSAMMCNASFVLPKTYVPVEKTGKSVSGKDSSHMAPVEAFGIERMNQVERLLMLFRAFRDKNEDAFTRVAEAIIADELAANHHSNAKQLETALRDLNRSELKRRSARLVALPRDRRSGDRLLDQHSSAVDSSRLMLADEAQAKLVRVIEEHRNRVKLAKFGLTPKSKLLYWGPPGCGKTLASNWIAQELGLPISVVQLSSLISSYVGETATHIQRVFDTASASPMVLLIDEIDAIGKNRDDPHDVGELKRVVNSLLQAFDSFRSSESLVIAASNHQYLLDPALWRRFDEVVYFPPPKPAEIRRFVERLLNGVTMKGNLDAAVNEMKSLSYADIEKHVVNTLKSMILNDENEFSLASLSKEVASFQKEHKAARKRTNGGNSK
jgi:SpoVK/Ycf46/Vps4 family AAA+-type ATPase